MALFGQLVDCLVTWMSTSQVVVYAHSGGTITAYAFLMSQTEAWRKQNILAYMPVVPVFGGTIASVQAIVSGWNQYGPFVHPLASHFTRCW